ncbi:MAG: GumC family protein [Candidatus Binatia bacterium]
MPNPQLLHHNGGGAGTTWPAEPPVRRLGASTTGDLHYYWRVFYGRRWLLIASSLLGLALAVVYTVRQPRLYQAQATVEFKAALPPGKDLELLNANPLISPALAVRLLTTKVLAARVIKTERKKGQTWFNPAPAASDPSRWQVVRGAVQGGLATVMAALRVALGGAPPAPDDAAGLAGAEPEDREGVDLGTIGSYYSYVSIRPEPMTSLADIVVTYPVPEISAEIANAHAEAFINMDMETKVSSLGDAQSLLRQQLDEVKAKLETSRKALSDYQSAHGIVSLPKDNTTITRESLQQLNKLLTEAQGERIVAEASYRNAKTMSPERLAEVFPDPGLKKLRSDLLELRATYAARLNEYGRNHPDMIAMRAQIESLRAQLRTAAVQTREQLRAAFTAGQAKEHELRLNFEQLSKAARQEDRGFVQLLILQRDVDTNQGLYTSVLQQAKEADLNSGAFRWTSVKLVDRAVVPNTPSYPRTQHNLELGLLFGLFAGIFACLLIERVDTRIHTPEDAEALLQLPTFGVVPDFHRLAGNGSYGRPLIPPEQLPETGRELVTLLHPASAVSEAYRSIRTNVLFSSPGSPPKTILVTSSQAGEGKTVTVINLAVSLALSGARVLIVDADMRKPGCHGPMQVGREPGLSNVLTGQCELAAAVAHSPLFGNGKNGHTHAGGVHILPAGAFPPNPAELVGSGVMGGMLETLKEQYEFILIDSPPVLPVTDSVVMATKADGVLLVVKGGEWGRDVVQKAVAQLDAVRSRLLGVVLNCVDVTRSGAPYYYYRHYYGHAYYGKNAAEDEERA